MVKEIFVEDFYSDGRGPELQKVIWSLNGSRLVGFEYYNPDVDYTLENLKHLRLNGVEAYQMSLEAVHPNILASAETNGAVFEVLGSNWLKSLNGRHLNACKHYQIVFYDEVFDIVCKSIECGAGHIEVK